MPSTRTVSLAAKNLRCQILRCPAEGVGLVRVLHVEFAETEVAQGDVTGVVEKDVLGFQITGFWRQNAHIGW